MARLNRWMVWTLVLGAAAAGMPRRLVAVDAQEPTPAERQGHPALEMPTAWFVGGEEHGLVEKEGKVMMGEKALALPEVAVSRVGAAWYPKKKLLELVQADGVVDLYRMADTRWELIARRSPDVASRNASVHFTMVPGLLYVLNYDVKKEAELNSGPVRRQEYADIYQRLALTTAAEDWEAVPQTGDKGLLTAAYRDGSRETWLYTSPSQSVTLMLPNPPAAPFRSGPADELAQAVFVMADHRFVVRRDGGWTVCDEKGRNIRDFADLPGESGWWEDPTLKDGEVRVLLRNGPGGTLYGLNLQSGERVVRSDR